jgi:hypothetical protein
MDINGHLGKTPSTNGSPRTIHDHRRLHNTTITRKAKLSEEDTNEDALKQQCHQA